MQINGEEKNGKVEAGVKSKVLALTKRFPIYITHTKPAETELIMAEIERFDRAQPGGRHVAHDIHWLRAGDVFVI